MADVMTEEDAPNTTFLKAVVIILGFLIIGVACLIIFTIYKRAMTPSIDAEISATPVPDQAASNARSKYFGDVEINVPAGLSPIDVSSSGNKAVVTYGTAENKPVMIVVIDLNSGEVLGRITVKK